MSTADTDVRVIVCLPHSVVTRQLAVDLGVEFVLGDG